MGFAAKNYIAYILIYARASRMFVDEVDESAISAARDSPLGGGKATQTRLLQAAVVSVFSPVTQSGCHLNAHVLFLQPRFLPKRAALIVLRPHRLVALPFKVEIPLARLLFLNSNHDSAIIHRRQNDEFSIALLWAFGYSRHSSHADMTLLSPPLAPSMHPQPGLNLAQDLNACLPWEAVPTNPTSCSKLNFVGRPGLGVHVVGFESAGRPLSIFITVKLTGFNASENGPAMGCIASEMFGVELTPSDCLLTWHSVDQFPRTRSLTNMPAHSIIIKSATNLGVDRMDPMDGNAHASNDQLGTSAPTPDNELSSPVQFTIRFFRGAPVPGQGRIADRHNTLHQQAHHGCLVENHWPRCRNRLHKSDIVLAPRCWRVIAVNLWSNAVGELGSLAAFVGALHDRTPKTKRRALAPANEGLGKGVGVKQVYAIERRFTNRSVFKGLPIKSTTALFLFYPRQFKDDPPYSKEYDHHFFKKVPQGAEAVNILVGETHFLKHPVSAFVRLKEACRLGDMTEVPVPTRFLFILLGTPGNGSKYQQIGRAMGTLFSDEMFLDFATRSRSRNDLLAGIDEFLSASSLLPPGQWDPASRIEPPHAIPSQACFA
ncbi:unnamed protein product [Mesocestoides corti]|uniref:Band 3 cytoplasmic domain-containing protein n=1 Tax=Mesocestoides corti TaxID=53468 RepID=A0A3P6GB85_MESCO|nr:unnamed protein product [Mesocestoides corti]